MTVNLLRLLIISLLVTGWFQHASAATVEVCFLSEAKISDDIITLEEIASIYPASAAERYGNKILFQAPGSGESRVYKASTLKAYVLDAVSGESAVEWCGAKDVVVHRNGRLISQDMIEKIIERYLDEKSLELPVKNLKFDLTGLPRQFTIPNGELESEVIPSNSNVIGSRYLTLRFRVNGSLVASETIRGSLQATAPVVVAARDLERGEVLSRSDLEIQNLDITGQREPCTSKSQAVGKILKRGLGSGQIVEMHNLDRQVLVNRGDLVTMVAERGALQVSARGVAASNGRKGDVITVNNIRSQESILCRVVDVNRVLVEF